MSADRAGLTIRGPHTNVRRDLARIFSGRALFSPKSLRPFFSRHYVQVFTEGSNVQTSKQRGKNLAADRGPPGSGYNRHNG